MYMLPLIKFILVSMMRKNYGNVFFRNFVNIIDFVTKEKELRLSEFCPY